MATTYDKASLVMIPSGYKDDKLYSVKPTDGSGDFTFSRDGAGASPATRVNASGLIEKGRTNELLQSNTFDTTWTLSNASVTGGQAGYDGSNDAWELDVTTAAGHLQQSFTAVSGVHTISLYAKQGTLDFLMIYARDAGGSNDAEFYFDLANGVTGSTKGAAAITLKITDVGGGWYRCEGASKGGFDQYRIYGSNVDNNITGTGNIYIQDAQLEQGLVATDYIETTTAAVSAGLLGDMPRLDYSGGATCPSLLLEPSRVNIQDQSEYIASWLDVNSTQESNYATSPEGVQNATRMVMTSATGEHSVYDSVSVTSGTQYTQSIFLKQGDGSANWRYFQFRFRSGGFGGLYGVVVDLQEGTIGYDTGLDDYGIENYGNGWYRVWITATATTTSSSAGPVVAFNELADAYDVSIVGDTNADVLIWGSQFESGSYPTSYIPTYGSASTRGADALSLTDLQGNGILPALNEGTLFLDLEVSGKRDSAGSYRHFRLVDNIDSANNRIRIWEGSAGVISSIRVDFSGTNIEHSFNADTPNKLAVSWGAGGTKIFLNGSVTDSVATRLAFASTPKFLTNILSNYRFDQILLFPTELTQAEVETLTTL